MLDNVDRSLFSKQEQSLEECVSEIDRFDNMNYMSVLNCIGSIPQKIAYKESVVERTWIDGNYSVCLLFDQQDNCLGVWMEEKKQEMKA